MKRRTAYWQLAGFITVSLLGTLLHFLYDWTGSPLAALFSGVNESTWEHMKLLFFPMLLFAVVQNRFMGKEYANFQTIKLRGTLIGLTMIPVLFYTLRGIFGATPDWINIAIFFVSAALGFLDETKQFRRSSPSTPRSGWAFLIFCLLAVAFWIFTFIPPALPLFRDPVDGSYGIQR